MHKNYIRAYRRQSESRDGAANFMQMRLEMWKKFRRDGKVG
jgi:hypothetical protein